MKSTDIIQPTAIAQPVATNGTKNTIPEDATGSNLASIQEGFPDITMQALSDGGLPPMGEDFNGLFYLSTDQRTYLQNGGIITFSDNVSNAIGGYPAGAVLDYINSEGIYCKVKSLIDDNTYNFIDDSSYINDTYWSYLDFYGTTSSSANTSLSNLIQTGENKLNYNVFCVNTGDITDAGKSAFLSIVETTDDDVTTSVLTTSGEFDVTTAAGKTYTITDILTLDISDYEDGTYNVYVNPVDLTLSVIDNTITYGITFPDDAADGDYLLNTAKVPYDLQKINITTDEDTEETATTITTGLNEVYTGTLVIE